MAVNLNRASLLRCHLRAGVALMALTLAAQAAHAQVDVTQTNVSNSGAIVNGSPDLTAVGVGGLTSGVTYQVVTQGTTSLSSQSVDSNGVFTYDGTALTGTGTFIPYLPNAINSGNAVNLGTGSSASIGATGAVASVSVSSINMALPNPSGGFGAIAQGVNNSGDVTNAYGYTDGGGAFRPTAALQMNLGGGSIGQGASASISASGAVASVSVSGVDDGSGPGSFSLPAIDSVSQYQSFVGWDVNNYSYGARTDVALAGPYPGVTNSGDVFNWGAISGIGTMAPGGSISVSGSGAVASVSLSTAGPGVVPDTSVGADPGDTLPYTVNVTASGVGNVGQWSQNTGSVTNQGSLAFAGGGSLGVGGSASVSATGAVASLGSSNVNVNLSGLSFGAVEQGALNLDLGNSASIDNTGTIDLAAQSLAQGASASVSATGAVASVSLSGVSGGSTLNVGMPSIGGQVTYPDGTWNTFGIAQLSQNELAISNDGAITGLGGNMAAGASASVSASGAVSSVSFSGNNVNLGGGQTISSTAQEASNSGSVYNTGRIEANTNTTLGQGASASVSATGAVASFSLSANEGNLGSLWLDSGYNPLSDDYPSLTQYVNNFGAVTNANGTIDLGAAGDLGLGASASVSATGAVSSFSVSGVSSSGTADVWMPYVEGTIGLFSASQNDVLNSNAVITAGDLASGASVSASATGSVSSFGISGNNVDLMGDTGGPPLGRFEGVVQSSYNSDTVTNSNALITAGNLGTGASASIGATGAVSSVSVSALNSGMFDADGGSSAIQFTDASMAYESTYGAVNQRSTNYSAITNSGTINLANGTAGVGALSRGASASVSASGAVASMSVSGVSDGGDTLNLPAVYDRIDQGWSFGEISNSGTVSNTGKIANAGDLDVGASASVSASGAVASVSISGNNVTMYGDFFDGVRQSVGNTGSVTNSAAPGGGQFGITAGDLAMGASVSASATGSVASVSVSALGSSLYDFYFRDRLEQYSYNSGTITNTATIDLANGDGGTGDLGRGASASISATGAVASISMSAVSGTGQTVEFPNVDYGLYQEAFSYGASVTNTGAITHVGDLAAGASASISASGSVASIGISGNNVRADGAYLSAVTSYVDQTSRNQAVISNTGTALNVGSLGNGASASISATGAVAAVSFSMLDTSFVTSTGFGTENIYQTATNENSVTNDPTMVVGALAGVGSSASIGATGAVASVGYSSTASTGTANPSVSFGNILQTATNGYNEASAPVTNTGSIEITGGMAGIGSSASVSASGAVASTSYSSVSSAGTSNPGISVGNVSQTANNGDGSSPAVINSGDITIGGNMAKGASASISATGAAASFQVASLNDTAAIGSISVGSITQTSRNYGAVSNSGSIAFNGGGAVTLGAGASASISATGAAASVSFRAVK